MTNIHKAILCAGLMASASSFAADTLYSVQSQSLNGRVLFDQQVTDGGMITLKPSLPDGAQGDLATLAHCLWSVKVKLSNSQTEFLPGKMVCVGPKNEVLETLPVGKFEVFGHCENGCNAFSVRGNDEVVMELLAPLEFTLQPRNERK